MAEHLTAEQLEHYRVAALPFAELVAADEHMESCGECQQRMRALLVARGAPSAPVRDTADDEPDPHLTYELKAGFIRGKLDPVERETIELHRQACQNCAEELERLAAFAHSMLPEPRDGHIQLERTLLEKLRDFLRLRRWAAVAVATVLAIAGIAAGAEAFASLRNQQISLLSGCATVVLLAVISLVWVLRTVVPAGKPRWVMQFVPMAALLVLVVAGSLLLRRSGPRQTQIGLATGTSTEAQTSRSIGSNLRDILKEHRAEALAGAEKLVDGGHTITVTPDGQVLGLDYLPKAYRETVAGELTHFAPSSRETPSNGGESNASFHVISPLAEPLESDRPTFHWTSIDGATYTLYLYDADGHEIRAIGPLRVDEWTPSSRLSRGKTYQWRVEAQADGRTLRTSTLPGKQGISFSIISAVDERELAEARAENPNSHLLLGIVYEQLGMFDDAETEFVDLAKANPNSSLAQSLLSQAAGERTRQRQ